MIWAVHRPVPGDTRSVALYYDETWFDYRALWLNRRNRALHLGYWDAWTRSHSQSLTNVNRALAHDVQPRSGQLMLDAGCGVGGTAMWMAEHHDVRVVGITVSEDQAQRARRYAAERGLEGRVEFSVQDHCQTALADGTLDVVYAVESVCYAPDKSHFVGEAFRLLRPGGRLVVQDGFRVARQLSEGEERLQRSWLSGWMVPELARLDAFVAACTEAGFVGVEAHDTTEHFHHSCRRLYRLTAALSPLELALRAVGLRSEVQHHNARAARDQWRALKRGLWVHATVVADKP